MHKFSHRFLDRDYDPEKGVFGEDRLIGVNHICLHADCVIFNDMVLPFGEAVIEKEGTHVIDEIFNHILPILNKEENKNKKTIVCGQDPARRMLGRKLEDRMKREVFYV